MASLQLSLYISGQILNTLPHLLRYYFFVFNFSYQRSCSPANCVIPRETWKVLNLFHSNTHLLQLPLIASMVYLISLIGFDYHVRLLYLKLTRGLSVTMLLWFPRLTRSVSMGAHLRPQSTLPHTFGSRDRIEIQAAPSYQLLAHLLALWSRPAPFIQSHRWVLKYLQVPPWTYSQQ